MSAIEQTPEGLRLKIILQPKASKDQIAVSYTHLTLPTICSV